MGQRHHVARFTVRPGRLLLPLLCLLAQISHGQSRSEPIVGSLDGKDYVHASGVFKVKDVVGAKISDSQGNVMFTYTMLGSITGWDEVAFVAPELSADRTHLEVIESILARMSEERPYKRMKVRLSVSESEEHLILGRQALYAKVLYPEFPGTGMTVFQAGGKQRDADFFAHYDIIEIRDLGLRQRNLRVDYLLVTSMRAAPMEGEDRGSHNAFLERLEFIAGARSAEAPVARAVSGAERPSDYLDLAIGHHEISAHFGYEVASSRYSPPRIIIYHVAEGPLTDRTERLGELLIDGIVIHDRSRHSAFALSEDGKTLLYMHRQYPYLSGSLKDKPQGLYEYVHEKGDRLIRAKAILVWGSEKLPNDAIRFGEATADETYVRRTSGDEYLVGKPGWTDLHRAAYLGQVAELERLLEAGLELDRPDGYGYTPLHTAVANRQDEAARVLVEHGANVNTRLNPATSMITPMHSAAYGSTNLIKLLLSKGADIDSRDGNGSTPLHYVVRSEKFEAVASLIGHGADVNARNGEGNTALHVFARGYRDERSAADWASDGNEALLTLLLSSGADVNAKNNRSETPLQHAVFVGNMRTAQVLVANGADDSLIELSKNGETRRMTLHDRIASILASRPWKTGARQ